MMLRVRILSSSLDQTRRVGYLSVQLGKMPFAFNWDGVCLFLILYFLFCDINDIFFIGNLISSSSITS